MQQLATLSMFEDLINTSSVIAFTVIFGHRDSLPWKNFEKTAGEYRDIVHYCVDTRTVEGRAIHAGVLEMLSIFDEIDVSAQLDIVVFNRQRSEEVEEEERGRRGGHAYTKGLSLKRALKISEDMNDFIMETAYN